MFTVEVIGGPLDGHIKEYTLKGDPIMLELCTIHPIKWHIHHLLYDWVNNKAKAFYLYTREASEVE